MKCTACRAPAMQCKIILTVTPTQNLCLFAHGCKKCKNKDVESITHDMDTLAITELICPMCNDLIAEDLDIRDINLVPVDNAIFKIRGLVCPKCTRPTLNCVFLRQGEFEETRDTHIHTCSTCNSVEQTSGAPSALGCRPQWPKCPLCERLCNPYGIPKKP